MSSILKQVVVGVCFALAGNAVAGVGSDKTVYRGGTVEDLEQGQESRVDLNGPDAVRLQAKHFTFAVPYDKIVVSRSPRWFA